MLTKAKPAADPPPAKAGDPVEQARQLWLAAELSEPAGRELLVALLTLPNDLPEVIRPMVVRLADRYYNPATLDANKNPTEFVKAAPLAVRREYALFAWKFDPERVKPLFYALARQYDGQDRFYLAALNIACGTDPERRDKILADFDKHFPEWNDKVADLVWELRPKSVLPRLVKLLDDAKLTAKQKARIVDILAGSDDPASGKMLLEIVIKKPPVEVRERVLENLRLFLPTKWKSLAAEPELREAINKLTGNDATRGDGLRLIAVSGVSGTVGYVSDLAKSEKNMTVRLEAIRTLGALPLTESVETLERLTTVDGVVGIEAIASLGQHLSANPKRENSTATLALAALQRVIERDGVPADLSQAALAAPVGSFNGTQWLLDAHEKKELPADLVADAAKLLRNSPYQGLRNRALTMFPSPNKLDLKKLPPLAELAKRIGDVERGKEIWALSFKSETQCARCHVVDGRGGQIGPDLSMIGKKASKENLFESILLPSKAIADQFLQWKIETTAGQTILGLIIEETPNAVTIRDANGKDTKIAKVDIDTRTKSAVSIMPEDIVKSLTEDDLVDVVAYMFTLRTEANIVPPK